MISTAKALEMLTFYINAEQAVLSGKEVQHGTKVWKREDLGEIRKGRQEWETKYKNLIGNNSGPALASFE